MHGVGYQGIKTGETDYSQIGGTFTTVSSNDNVFCLKDLTVTVLPALEPTYDSDRKRWKGGCRAPADFVLNIMDKNGHFEKTYYWQYYKSGSESNPTVVRGWFKDDGFGDYEPLSEEELTKSFKSGQGFYISGGGNSLTPAGTVSKNEIHFVCNETDYTLCGNGTPVDMTLGDLTVTVLPALEPTYDSDRKRWKGGCRAPADFVLNIMDKNGHFDATYYWQYYKTGSADAPTVIQGWFKDDGMGDYVKLEKEELDKIKVPAGKAFYISGGGNTLNVPAPEL